MTFRTHLATGLYLIQRLLKQLSLLGLMAVLVVPLTGSRMPTLLEQIQQSGTLVVISRNGPTTYYEGSNGLTGFEYTMAKAFADSLGVELQIQEIEDLGLMLHNVGRQGHFAAAGLTVTERRQQKVTFSKAYTQVTQQLLYHTSQDRPTNIEDLIGKRLMVISGSSHAERLRQLQKEHPGLTWEERHDIEMLDLMEMVHQQKIDHAIVDSNAFRLNTSLYPRAQVAFAISDPEDLAWAFPTMRDASLLNAANAFLTEYHTSGILAEVQEVFYGHLGELNYSGALIFTRRMESRLPEWREHLKEAAENAGVDWLLLAALGYQESHWDPEARSPTGVRGFMMLTLPTAKEMEISNRLNPLQSIDGGARYFRRLLDRIPESITGKDRIWLALAAYNVGYGHVEDARILAQHYGANPNKWADVKEYLPLLTKRQYYKYTRHGYARGHEAVTYVQNIRNFYAILAWNEHQQERLQLAMNEAKAEESEFNAIIGDLIANQTFASSM